MFTSVAAIAEVQRAALQGLEIEIPSMFSGGLVDLEALFEEAKHAIDCTKPAGNASWDVNQSFQHGSQFGLEAGKKTCNSYMHAPQLKVMMVEKQRLGRYSTASSGSRLACSPSCCCCCDWMLLSICVARTSQPGETGLGPHTPSTCAGTCNQLLLLLLLSSA